MTARIPMIDYLVLDDGPPHLVAHECAGCGALYLDRRNACGRCSGRSFGSRALSATGKVRAFTIVHRAAPGIPTPYVSAIVDLDGGGVVKANLVGVDAHPEKIDPGMAVRLATFTAGTDDDGTEAIAFGFEPV